MTTWRLLTTAWGGEPSVLVGCTVLIGAYVAMTRRRPTRAAWAFFAGIIVLLFAQTSPLDALGDTYLFSAHMIQHLLLVLIVPPLLILGIPVWLVEQWLAAPRIRVIERVLRAPMVAWPLGIGAMYLWHIPAPYNATLAHTGIHIVEHLCFLVTGVIFWWPVCAPLPECRFAPLAAMLYLFTGAVASSVLGIVLTFTAPGLYPAYLQSVDARGYLSLIRDGWGLSPAVDQQLGGLVMWVPGGLVYLGAIVGTFARWYAAEEMLSAEYAGSNSERYVTEEDWMQETSPNREESNTASNPHRMSDPQGNSSEETELSTHTTQMAPAVLSTPPDWQTLTPAALPRPTYWPVVMAGGIVFMTWGIATTLAISAIGLVLFALALAGWIGEWRHGH